VKDVIAGGPVSAPYVKPLAFVAVCWSGFMTTTSTGPVFVADGVVTVSCVGLLNVREAADLELGVPNTLFDGSSTKETVAPLTKFVPVLVGDVPPERRPEAGETVEMAGAAGTLPPATELRQEAAAIFCRTEPTP
jgi:hypothetical protein